MSTKDGSGEPAPFQPMPPLTVEAAKRITKRIQLRLDTIADNAEAVVPLIEQAKAGDAHQVLGFPSWTAYVSEKFGGTLGRLDRSERQPLVLLLAEQGMSTRAIAPIVGAGHATVARDIETAGVSGETPAPDPEPHADNALDIVSDTLGIDRPPLVVLKNPLATTAKNVVGMDGKTYPRPEVVKEPAKRHRRPLPTAYRDYSENLLKNIESLSRLHQDDRFAANREAVQQRSRADLARAANGLLDLLDDLGVDRHRHGGAR